MDVNPKQRRRHGAAFKAQVLAACAELGASVAAVALSCGSITSCINGVATAGRVPRHLQQVPRSRVRGSL